MNFTDSESISDHSKVLNFESIKFNAFDTTSEILADKI